MTTQKLQNLFCKFLGLLALLLFAMPTQARAEGEQSSVEWQRLKLERELEAKLRESLSPVLPQNQYLVSVQIALSEVDTSATKDSESTAVRGPASTSDLPLSKLGFWGPLLQDLQQGGSGPGWANVFGRLSQVDVKVIVDNTVSDAKRTLVEEILNRGVQGLSRVKPVVEVAKGDLSSPAQSVARTAADWVLEFKNGISLLLAVFTGVFLLALLGFFVAKDFTSIFRKGFESVDSYITFQKEKSAPLRDEGGFGSVDEMGSGPGTVVGGNGGTVVGRSSGGTLVQSMAPMMAAAPMAMSMMSSADPTKDGFQKFHELYEKSPEMARGLVKKWINARTPSDAKALSVLGQRASVDDLNDLFGSLPMELKQSCRILISTPFGADAFAEGLDYMRRQVMEQYVSARPSLPEATLALIDSVTEKEFMDIAQADTTMGAMLLSAMPTSKVSSLLGTMPTNLFSTLSERTGEIFDKDLSSESSRVEEAIRSLRERQAKRSAFLEKSAELIPSASPEKEVILYRMLIQAGDLDMVRDTALKSLPSSLVTQLPADVVQRILTRMSANDRSELICSQPQSRANFLLACLGDPGDKLRDLVDSEVQDVQADANRVEALREDAETLWSSLVTTLRQMQRQNPVFARSLRPIVNRWVKDLSEGGTGQSLEDAA